MSLPRRSLSSLLALLVLAFLSLLASALPPLRTASSTAALKLAVRINSYGIKNVAAADQTRSNVLHVSGRHRKLKYLDRKQQASQVDYHESGHTQ
ncbi:hypothetical protein BD769DRAFT_1674343 [Suillus cothurnatus]|nr:hypothetical protein BD769DRAFT_1674343 [Suillus cothurnatus]